ncbi:hypothetical protein EHP00_2277 [Ecytonucleospora hepatopenaei]|uniref:Uncharacterized protein n=1 Tax=Ecytonucleospora hepatopenaei TaxID=646526 RepID=A0A1W0E3K6_9MICR|nr:hypothetical protein EHP00_2277 [Ecytonucleospora hepatopenaei]
MNMCNFNIFCILNLIYTGNDIITSNIDFIANNINNDIKHDINGNNVQTINKNTVFTICNNELIYMLQVAYFKNTISDKNKIYNFIDSKPYEVRGLDGKEMFYLDKYLVLNKGAIIKVKDKKYKLLHSIIINLNNSNVDENNSSNPNMNDRVKNNSDKVKNNSDKIELVLVSDDTLLNNEKYDFLGNLLTKKMLALNNYKLIVSKNVFVECYNNDNKIERLYKPAQLIFSKDIPVKFNIKNKNNLYDTNDIDIDKDYLYLECCEKALEKTQQSYKEKHDLDVKEEDIKYRSLLFERGIFITLFKLNENDINEEYKYIATYAFLSNESEINANSYGEFKVEYYDENKNKMNDGVDYDGSCRDYSLLWMYVIGILASFSISSIFLIFFYISLIIKLKNRNK